MYLYCTVHFNKNVVSTLLEGLRVNEEAYCSMMFIDPCDKCLKVNVFMMCSAVEHEKVPKIYSCHFVLFFLGLFFFTLSLNNILLSLEH